MAQHHGSHSLEVGGVEFDDDGRAARTGTTTHSLPRLVHACVGSSSSRANKQIPTPPI